MTDTIIWKTLNISKEQYELVAKIIEDPMVKAKYDFRSVPDFIRRAISDKVEVLSEESPQLAKLITEFYSKAKATEITENKS